MSTLRVAWLGHRSHLLGGGMATYSRETVRGLRERGVSVTFFHHGGLAQPPDPPAEADEAVALASVPLLRPLVYSPPEAKRALTDRLRRGDFDLVHASFWFSNLDFDLPRLCRELRIPLVATFHVAFDRRLTVWGGLTKATYRVYARALRGCSRVIVFGSAQADLLKTLGVPEDTLAILPNGVDVDKYSPGPSDVRQRHNARHLFVYLGRLDTEKNVDVLLRAFLASQPDDSCRLLVAGTGGERRRLQRAFRDPRVVFAGHVADEAERIAILRAADGFFLPSTVEALSLSLLEAMACGAPVAATDVGADGEALRGAGIVLEPMRLEGELRLAMRTLVELPELRETLGRAARRRVVERFSLSSNLDRLVALYQEVSA